MAKYIASRRSGQLRRQLLPLERLLNLVSVVIYPWLINCQVPSRQPGRRRAQPRVGGAAPRQRRRRRFKRLLVIYEAKPISPAPRPWSADADRRRAARNNEACWLRSAPGGCRAFGLVVVRSSRCWDRQILPGGATPTRQLGMKRKTGGFTEQGNCSSLHD